MKQIQGKTPEKGIFGENSRTAIIMLNAVVVLLVVIIALITQLIKINSPASSTVDAAKSKAVLREQEPEQESESTAKSKKNKLKDSQKVEKIRKNLDKDKPMVALTFDDGPYGKVTNRIVKTLKKHDSRATFFVVGNRIPKYPFRRQVLLKPSQRIPARLLSLKKRNPIPLPSPIYSLKRVSLYQAARVPKKVRLSSFKLMNTSLNVMARATSTNSWAGFPMQTPT